MKKVSFVNDGIKEAIELERNQCSIGKVLLLRVLVFAFVKTDVLFLIIII